MPGREGRPHHSCPDKAPGDPQNSRVSAVSVAQPNSFISRVGEGRQERKRTLSPRWGDPGRRPPLLAVSSSTAGAGSGLGAPGCSAQRGQVSDFNGSCPSQQHFGLRRDTERRETERGKRRAKEGGEGEAEREQTEENRKRNQKRNQTTRKFVRFPSSILFAFLFLVSCFFFFFFKAFSMDWGAGSLGLFTPVPDPPLSALPTRFHPPWLRDRPCPSLPLRLSRRRRP